MLQEFGATAKSLFPFILKAGVFEKMPLNTKDGSILYLVDVFFCVKGNENVYLHRMQAKMYHFVLLMCFIYTHRHTQTHLTQTINNFDGRADLRLQIHILFQALF